MTNPRIIPETTLPNLEGQLVQVKKGSKVNLRALVAHKDLNDDADESEDNEYFDKKDIDNYHEWLGKGPYSISRIGRWPCGQITLYVDSKKSKGSGVYAENFVCID